MININSVVIDPTATKINVNIDALGLIGVTFWTWNTYDDPSQGIDLTSLIPAPQGNNYTFVIDVSDVNLTNFNGLFFIEFTFDNLEEIDLCHEEANKRLSVVANLTQYYNCLLDKVLKSDIKGCGQKESNCVECENDMMQTHVLLSTLQTAIRFGFFNEAIRIVEVLDDFCEICHSCPPYGDINIIGGYTFGIVNNSLTLL